MRISSAGKDRKVKTRVKLASRAKTETNISAIRPRSGITGRAAMHFEVHECVPFVSCRVSCHSGPVLWAERWYHLTHTREARAEWVGTESSCGMNLSSEKEDKLADDCMHHREADSEGSC
jgi:hypothetical protein